ncbi:MAG: elongation factor Ts [Clostridia bacterium]|nr:elongation factor Ts [Clostridia bacterium]
MAEISAKVVMDLRGRTGAGMMDCKKALAATNGDIEKAIDFLREKGLASAAKKQSRIASEGIVGSYLCDKCGCGVLVEVNCETDFVAKTDKFQNLVSEICKQIIRVNPADVEALLATKYYANEEQTIDEMVKAATAEIGEKISIRRFARYEGNEAGKIDSYIHMGGKVGVLVEAKGEINEAALEVIHDVALQIAAASPVAPEYVRREEVDPSHLEHEKEILVAQARNEGKPEKIIEKMVEGRIKKFYQDVCLLEQAFVKDGDKSVQQMINEKAKGLEIVRFTRYKMGDGLEKKVNDLAAEVAEQTAKMGL